MRRGFGYGFFAHESSHTGPADSPAGRPGPRPRAAAITAQTRSAPTYRALADKGLLRKDYLNGDAGGGGVYYWNSKAEAEAWYTPEWFKKAKEAFGAEPSITYYDSYVTVDNETGQTIVRD